MIRGVITDLDGTLLDENHFLSEYTKNVVNELLDRGYFFYIATGRVERGAKLIANQFNKKIPIITTNGARVIDSESNEIISVKLDRKCVDILTNYDYTKYSKEVFINGYSDQDWYVLSEKYKDYYHKKRLDKTFSPEIITKEEFNNKEFNKIFFVGPYEALLQIRNDILPLVGESSNVDFVSEKSLEIYDKKVNKGIAAELILEKDGLTVDEVICFGDGLNDYEMLRRIPNSFIMENALEELKKNYRIFQ